jgi:hypothetical protein
LLLPVYTILMTSSLYAGVDGFCKIWADKLD